jgi:FkbM family methyltransferase
MDFETTRAARESFLERAEELTPLIAVDTDDGRFLLSTIDRHITKALVLKSARGEMKILRRALAVLAAVGIPVRGGTFLDVGANIGTTTIPALRTHGFTRGVAFEPEPQNLLLLELNLIANDLDRDVEICRAAIGEEDGEVELVVSDRMWGLHEVRLKGAPLPGWAGGAHETTTVRQFALDTLAGRGVFDPDDVGLVWIDAEGHEGHILRGAQRLTERGVPVLMELNPEPLRRHGGLEAVLEIARVHYTHLVRVRHVSGRAGLRFDLDSTDRLDEEVEWLSRGARHTDVLLVREPRSSPAATSPPRPDPQPREAVVMAPDPDGPTLREPERIPAREWEEFVREARPLTPLLAARLDGATFIVRTDVGADELSLFAKRSHPHLRLLDSAVAALDELGLGAPSRAGTFVQASAGVGIATVAALCRIGFARGLACEPDLSTYRVLKLNTAANGLTGRVRTLPIALDGEASGDSLDGLLSRGVIEAGDAGLIWIADGDAARTFAAATNVLADGPPLLVLLGEEDGVALVDLLTETHTHYVAISRSTRQAVPLAVRPLAGHALVVRLP